MIPSVRELIPDNIYITTTWIKEQKYWYVDDSNVVGFNDDSNIIWFIKSNCSDNVIDIVKYIASYLGLKYTELSIGIDPQIKCNINIHYRYVTRMSDSTIILSNTGSIERTATKHHPSLDMSVIKYYFERTKDCYETACQLIPRDNKLFMSDNHLTGSISQQSVNIYPHKYVIHSHLSNFYDKYGLFIASPSLTDIKFVLFNKDRVDTLFTSAKEGIWTLRINDVYKDMIFSEAVVNMIMNQLYPIANLRKDSERSITNTNKHKIPKLIETYASVTGKTVGLNTVYDDTPILSIKLDTWQSLRCMDCI